MKITENKEVLIQCQARLVREIVYSVRRELSQANLPGEQVQKLTERIVFEVANIIDDGAVEADGCNFSPNLTFMSDEDKPRHIGDPSGSWMHDYAMGVVDDVFRNPTA